MIRPKANSFTLVEMIGAMAILAILASVLAPSVVRQIQTATSVGEDANLADIAQALTNAIRTTGLIPNPNLEPSATNVTGGFGWAYLASNYTRLAGSKLVSVFPGMTNETGRRLYLSTNLVALAAQGGFANTVSNWGATLFPTNAKMYLVSASRPEFNLLLATNGAGAQTTNNSYASAAVNSLDSWVKQFSTNGVTVAPANIVDPSWTNRGEFLHVRTIDLAPIFSEVKAAQQKAIEQEDKNLEEIARALVAGIQATGTIPNPNRTPYNTGTSGGWGDIAYQYTTLTDDSVNAGTLHYVFPEETQSARRVYLNDQFMTYLVAATGGAVSGVFQTPATGWPLAAGGVTLANIPTRMYVVSGSKKDLFLFCGDNQATTRPQPTPGYGAGLIGDLQSWVKTVQPESSPNAGSIMVPSSIAQWGTASGSQYRRGEFLHVKVMDLRTLFCRVELEDLRSPATINLINPGNSYPATQTTNTNGITLRIDATTAAPSNITSASIISNPGKNLWVNSGNTSASWTNSGIIIGGGVGGIIDLVFPSAPNFAVGANPLSIMSAQDLPFYLLKGTSLNLSGSSTIINQDSKFQYSNGTWTQSY